MQVVTDHKSKTNKGQPDKISKPVKISYNILDPIQFNFLKVYWITKVHFYLDLIMATMTKNRNALISTRIKIQNNTMPSKVHKVPVRVHFC